jgi:hypothetical protein
MRKNRKNGTIILGASERALWDHRADGREVAETARRIRAEARAMASEIGDLVEIFAPQRAGGWTWDVIEPAEQVAQ